MGVNSPSVGSVQSKLTIAAPAAGAEWQLVVPAGNWIRVLLARFTFTTSAVVGNRTFGVKISDGVDDLGFGRIVTAIPASSGPFPVSLASGKQGFTGVVTQIAAGFTMNVPDLILPPGFIFGGDTQGKDAADQYSAVKMFIQTWTQAPIIDGLVVAE